ncbi:cyclase family protein [Micromonospora chersina]|uniref:cyclase family protein n=1 Tax=Micromonospora chersina TaxID=47854 RepID=UPI0037151E88
MTTTAIRLRTLIGDHCDAPASGITPATCFADLPGWSSLAALRLFTALEESFGISLDLRCYLAITTVAELTEVVTTELGDRPMIVDLTLPFGTRFPTHPANKPAEVEVTESHADAGCLARRWHLDEHSGTHVDAPIHFTAGGKPMDEIPAAHLMLPAAVLDVRSSSPHLRERSVTAAHIRAWEAEHGPLPGRCALLALTGWTAAMIDEFGQPTPAYDRDPCWPGFTPEAITLLREHRPQVIAIGIDAPSLDSTTAEDAGSPAHQQWLGGDRYGIENLHGLQQLPPIGATITVGALRLQGGSGAPARVLAILPATTTRIPEEDER